MQSTARTPNQPKVSNSSANYVSLLVALVILLATLLLLWFGFVFLRDNSLPKWANAIVAIIWGVGGTGLFFVVANNMVEQLPDAARQRIQPYIFVGPAVLLLFWFLALPTIRTIWFSLLDRNSVGFVGLQNYLTVLTSPDMLITFRNNLLWILFGATGSVIMGLLIATLADRSNFETLAKSIIFMPMAISLVGAGVIWNFIYEVRPTGDAQIGLLNAIVVALGGEPQAWTALVQPWNNLFLIIIMIWLQTGFAMVLFSAAIKGIPAELLEAARVDGANEWQVFFSIMVPYIMGTIITVSTTIIIFSLKIFDIVIVMTGGQFGTDVIATKFYREYFVNSNYGTGSALAVILLLAVVPVMIYNLRQFGQRKAF
ncbi:MAG: sugar ABC transporter permease [Caldilineaceae bacterium]